MPIFSPNKDIIAGSNISVTQTTTSATVAVANVGNPNGIASLDGGGKVPISQLPASIMEYKGTWDASTNSPTLADGTGDPGDTYRVNVGGTRNLGSGSISFDVGDYVIYNGSIWQKSDTTDAVASVNTLTGNVVLTTANIADSSNKRYVTDAQLTVLTNTSGTNTGDQDLSGYVPTTRTINAQPLSANITLTTVNISSSTDRNYVTNAQQTVLSNTSGTNTGDQNIFSTVAVGATNIVADTTSDTLTLVAGDGITLTPNATTDTITIAASSMSGAMPDYIMGLRIDYVGTNSVVIRSGAAYIPSTMSILTMSSNLTKTGISLSAFANFGFVYVYYYNNSGTPDVEFSTTEPTFYYATSSHKTGDSSRRLIGVIRCAYAASGAPPLARFTSEATMEIFVFKYQGYDNRSFSTSIPNNSYPNRIALNTITAVTQFNLTCTQNNASGNFTSLYVVPPVVFRSLISVVILVGGKAAGITARGDLATYAGGTSNPFYTEWYAQLADGQSGGNTAPYYFPFLPPTELMIYPPGGRTLWYTAPTDSGVGPQLYLDNVGYSVFR